MTNKSDEVEGFLDEARTIRDHIKKFGSRELSPTVLQEVAWLAKHWLTLAPSLRSLGVCDAGKLDQFDATMQSLLTSSGARARGTTVRNKLDPVLGGLTAAVIVPLIQFEGSPLQVAARQLQGVFTGLAPEEAIYVEEAARCLVAQCPRAAIIMLWAAAIARVHRAIEAKGFDAFNAAVDAITKKTGQPFNKVKPSAKVASFPELQLARDADLLIVGMELFQYDVQAYQELQRLLSTRNDCAHPGMMNPRTPDVQQFGAKVNDYVFALVKVN